jgi:hypothetical protein
MGRDGDSTMSDQQMALFLLNGLEEHGPDGFPSLRVLSEGTNPTEDEARAALTRLLLQGSLGRLKVPDLVLWSLAAVIAPDRFRDPGFGLFSPGWRRVIFKNRGQGHSQGRRHFEIACWIYDQRMAGKTEPAAVREAAARTGIKERQIRNIYATIDAEVNFAKSFGPLPKRKRGRTKIMQSVRRTDAI